MSGGLTFGAAKNSLRLVADNGVKDTDPRVMRRTNEATQELLAATIPAGYANAGAALIPVNGMMTAAVAVDADGNMLLPKEMENAIFVVPANGLAYQNADISQGGYDIVNPFTYVEPSLAYDNPLNERGLVPDPTDPTILRRQYHYQGAENLIVNVTGAKRYLPITSDDDYLIIQNVPALKLCIQAIELRENGKIDDSIKYKVLAVQMLADEVKKHQLDPRKVMKRRSQYEADLLAYDRGSMAWMRGRLALEVPGAMTMGRSDLTRVMERAEMRLMEMGTWKGCMEEFDATIIGGNVLFPTRVEAVLAFNACGQPMEVRSIFYPYIKNGPGTWDCSCGGYIIDQGEEYFAESNTRRRRFKVMLPYDSASRMRAVCKLRWVPKAPEEQMTIQNLEAMRLACDGILQQQAERWNEGLAALASAKDVLDKELKEYLSGIQPIVSLQALGNGDLGGVS